MSRDPDIWFLCEALGITLVVLAIEVLCACQGRRGAKRALRRQGVRGRKVRS